MKETEITEEYKVNEQNIHEILKYANDGNSIAQYKAGRYYEDKREYEKAFRLYSKAAYQNHAAAQNNLGNCYFYGEGVSEDKAKSFYWYRKSAEQGNQYAQSNLGNAYRYGDGVESNKQEAFRWYLKAAEQGNSRAQKNVGFPVFWS